MRHREDLRLAHPKRLSVLLSRQRPDGSETIRGWLVEQSFDGPLRLPHRPPLHALRRALSPKHDLPTRDHRTEAVFLLNFQLSWGPTSLTATRLQLPEKRGGEIKHETETISAYVTFKHR